MSIKITEDDHVQGPSGASVEIVEYADYECPHCGTAFRAVKEIQRRMGDSMKFAFRNMPLSRIHPHAVVAALAAETAGMHGKFWEMHDLLFENQQALEIQDILGYAEKIGLDSKVLLDELKNEVYFSKIKADVDSGVANGVEGTPTFFVNGEIYRGDWSGPEFIEYLATFTR